MKLVHFVKKVMPEKSLKAYGVVGTARWYLERGAGRRSVDVR
ncbi:hypothetical protein ACFVXQ_34945 [Kitasatospora sp. NPDC058263]